jgi:hypothetical protein
VQIYASEVDQAVFAVESDSSVLEELAALYLFLTCGESISSSGEAIDLAAVGVLREKYRAELGRANASIWHQSSAGSPYPNLR